MADAVGVPALHVHGYHRRAHPRLVARTARPSRSSEISESSDLPALRTGDLYPDARPCLSALQDLGLRVGVAANQPDRAAEDGFGIIGLDLDFVATSAAWGVAKPSPAFFERVAQELALPAPAIAYVGDRIDNDIEPAADARHVRIFLRRGPWA